MPNHSLKLTRYGTQRKPGPRPVRHHRVPGLRCAPPRATTNHRNHRDTHNSPDKSKKAIAVIRRPSESPQPPHE